MYCLQIILLSIVSTFVCVNGADTLDNTINETRDPLSSTLDVLRSKVTNVTYLVNQLTELSESGFDSIESAIATIECSGGGGNVSAATPFAANNALIRVDLPSGTRNIKQSDVILDNTNNMSGLNALSMSGTLNLLVQNELRLQDAAGGQYVGLRAPTTIPTSYTLTLPSPAPTALQTLQANATTPTDLEWILQGGSTIPSQSKIIYVSTAGNDTTGTGSLNAPYATLAKAIDTANALANSSNPMTIFMNPGIYIENNSSGPLTVTADGISIVGTSSSTVVVIPSTLSNDLFLLTTTIQLDSITFNANGISSASAITLTTGAFSTLNNLRIVGFDIGVLCQGTASTSYVLNSCLFVGNTTGLSIDDTPVQCNNCIFVGTFSLAPPPVNTALTATGANTTLILNGGECTLCNTGFRFENNAQGTITSLGFQFNTFDIIQTGASQILFSNCTFELTTDTGDIEVQASGAGTQANFVGCSFDGVSALGAAQATGIQVTTGATIRMSSCNFANYTTAVIAGAPGDTSSTQLLFSGSSIHDCTTDIVQDGSSTLAIEACSADDSKISINDATNVTVAFFDLDDNNALNIGRFADTDSDLIHAAIDTATNPKLSYKSSLYSTQAIGYENPITNPSTLFSLGNDDTHITGITTDRANVAGVRLVSDTASPVGGTTALRGWDVNKNASTAELSFAYQNSDLVGQVAVAPYTVMQLDGLNNQVQLPTAATQIVFATDTNLYRSAANILKTDDNLIVGGLTADRAVATNGSSQLVSSVTTATELGFLSGVTSAIQPQLDGKVSKSGDTMTGALQLPAGTTAAPSLRFTGSTTTGLSASAGDLSLSTNAAERLKISSAGTVSINELTVPGVVHNDASGNLTSSLIVNADVDPAAAIVDTKLATISTAGKVSNAATTATSANTANAIVARDASGNFTAGTITANLTGSVTGAASLNVLKAGDTMTGALILPAGTAAAPSLRFTGSTNTGISAATSNQLSFDTNGTERMTVSPTGTVAINEFTIAGVVHNDASGNLSSSLIVNNDITNATIANAKLATISSANTSGNIVVRDGSGNFSTTMITIDGTVTNPTDVATKNYVDSALATGLNVKDPAVVVSTLNVTISGTQTIDGVALVANDRVLLVNQTDPVENGLWLVQVGAWTRPTDFDTGDQATLAYVLILSGDVNAGSSWLCSTPTAIIDTDPIFFEQFSIPGQTTAANVGAGAGQIFRNKTGVTLNLKTLAAGVHMAITNNADDISFATDATSNNDPSTIVARDGSGDFSAGTITAALTGAASANVLKAGDSMTGTLNMLTQNEVRFQDAAGGQYVGLNAQATIPSSYTVSLPTTIPTANQVLKANGTTPTNLDWALLGGSVTPTNAKVIYVTKFGNDTTGDGSFNTPFASLSKAITTANGLATASNPIVILISAGIYVENNSAGPLTITATGISIVGESTNGVSIVPSTLSNNLILANTTASFAQLTLSSGGVSTAAGISLAGTGSSTRLTGIRVSSFQTGIACAGTSSSYLMELCTFFTNGTAISVNDCTAICNDCILQGSLTNTPANTGFNATGSAGSVIFVGGICSNCLVGFAISDNTICGTQATFFRNNTQTIVIGTSAHCVAESCFFRTVTIADPVTNITISDAGSTATITASVFDGTNAGGSDNTALQITDQAVVTITGGQITNYTNGILLGTGSDTSSTVLNIASVYITECTNDIIQDGTSTLNINACTLTDTKLLVNDATNVTVAFFDAGNSNVLIIGHDSDMDADLIRAALNSGNDPKISYLSSLYSTQAIGYENQSANPSTLFSLGNDDTHITGITTDRTNVAGVRLVSDTASPVGGTTALRGWDVNKNASTAELSFAYQNSDLVGQVAVAPYTVMQLDGLNNQVQLPTAATQIVFAADTNLYRSAANILRTDDNLIVGGLTANRAVATNGSSQLVSSITTATELGFLSGVTSAIQPQLNGKVSRSGDTMTGALTLPAGTTSAPSLNFTGSTTTGLSATTDNLSLSTNALERMKISSSGTVSINGLTVPCVVHNDASGNLSSSLIVNADVSASAAIIDTKLATISTAGKVANSATTATSANTASTIVARDALGDFSAGTITANVVGNVTGSASGNVLKTGDTMTGPLTLPAGSAAAPSLRFTGSTNTGISAATANQLSFDTNGTERMNISSTGAVTINGLNSTGIVHNNSSGLLTTSLIVNADVDPAAAIVDTKLATISTAGKVANSATTATSANTASAIVARDGSGNFSAGTITASLTGAASLNVLKAGDTMTGTLTHPAGSAAAPSIQFTGSTNTGFSAATANTLSFDTNGTERMNISTTDINLLSRVVMTNVLANQAIQVATPTGNGQSVTINPGVSLLLLTHTANRTNFTVNFPPSPINGQLFTIMLGTTNTITLINVGGTGGAAIVNGIVGLNPGAAFTATANGTSVTYLYFSTTNTWYRSGRG